MFHNFKNTNITINGRAFLISDAQLSQEIGLVSPIKSNSITSEQYLPQSPHVGQLRIKYYLTGQDYLKQYIYSDETNPLSGNVAGLIFNQGYLSNYNINCIPNSPVEINANIEFFDKISGSFTSSSLNYSNYKTFNLYNATIDNLSSYTTNTLTNITQANFSYNCQLNPSYKSYGTGITPTQADRISIGERTISAEITSDNINMDLPLSGDKFGMTITFSNPFDSSLNESFGVSGRIDSKTMNFSVGDVHSHNLRISQKHLNVVGEISGVITGTNVFYIFSTNGTHPWKSSDGSLDYVNKIFIEDVICPTFFVINTSGKDILLVNRPANLVNGLLTIEGTAKTFIFPTPIVFNYPQMIISGVSPNSGRYGTPINISGANLYQITNVKFNGIESRFQNVSSTLIQAIVPYNGLIGKIEVDSTKRNLTGFSSGFFYCEPEITSILPVTGMWKTPISIVGINFSGTTGVKFNGFNASGFTINSNTSITANSPETGAGYANGYITVLTSGGLAKSISIYKPHVPIYSFDPTSGIYFDRINIRTKIDTGYLFPSGNGVKIKFGNVDTVFYPSGYEINSQNKTGCLTGQIPFNATDDYIYLYQPDGVTTYTPNTGKFNVIAEPRIFSISPSIINQYKFYTPVLLGENFRYFSQKPYFFALSGGVDNNVQYYSNVNSNSGTLADTMYIPNVIITGSTGTYNVIVQNYAGSYTFTGGLLVKSGINRSLECSITSNTTLGTHNSHRSQYLIDNSTGTFGALSATTTPESKSFTLTPKNNDVIDISNIHVLMINLPTLEGHTPNPSGSIKLYHRNNATPIYNSSQIYLNGINLNLSSSPYTGIRTIKVFTPDVFANDTEYLGISELRIY